MYPQIVPSPLQTLIEQTLINKNLYKPLILNINSNHDRAKLDKILATNSGLQVFDTIKAQVTELIKCLQPAVGLKPIAELEKLTIEKLTSNSDYYGVWVYYPWSNKLVHLLDEEEFVVVRTNRNKHKITESEQQTLATKKIGVMGLSVGQSVSLTLAMERGFGELRIADFDELDLSNINRIRTGVNNIGIKKTVIVAREIAEIDPFLKVVCYKEGITAANLKDFLTKDGKLDLLIDECDSFDIKINSRKLAKELQIPVLMEGSDRGTIDIERFDLEPNRPVLHGMVDHLDMAKFKDLVTFDDKIPYITAVTGIETLSPRMKASAVELMSTISTWPQLASAVTFGGGVTADLSRKILLNHLKISGRFFLDLDEMISDKDKRADVKSIEPKHPLTADEIERYLGVMKKDFNFPSAPIALTENQLLKIITAVKLAPSGGNNQPWKLHYQDGLLHLFLDESEALAYLDPNFISSYISIGSAVENLLLAAATESLKVHWKFTPELAPKHLAVFSFSAGHSPDPQEIKLAAQIPLRHTNRKSSPRVEIDQEIMSYLSSLVAETEGAKLIFVTDDAKLKSLANIAVQTDLLRMFIPEAHEDFITREMRWTKEDAATTEDGIGIHTLDLNNNDQIGIRLLQDRRMVEFLKEIKGGSAFNRLINQQFTSSSAIGLITMPNDQVHSWLQCGRAAEKMWLAASDLDLKIHPVNVPILFFYKNVVEKSLLVAPEITQKLIQAEKELNLIFNKSERETSMFMFRIFKANESPERTIRKSNDKIFSIGRA